MARDARSGGHTRRGKQARAGRHGHGGPRRGDRGMAQGSTGARARQHLQYGAAATFDDGDEGGVARGSHRSVGHVAMVLEVGDGDGGVVGEEAVRWGGVVEAAG